MKLLLCCPAPLTKTQGAPKVWVELAEAMREQGWNVDLIGSDALCSAHPQGDAAEFQRAYPRLLRSRLQECAACYDVVDYDHAYLPFPRTDFCASTLMAARSVLLAQHLETIPLPTSRGWRALAGRVVQGRKRRQIRERLLQYAAQTVAQADVVNVSNEDDKSELVRRGLSASKILVLPYGIDAHRRRLFDSVSSAVPPQPVVTFVGTFDYRKGAREFPAIVRGILEKRPDARFKLLGTKGMMATAEAVLARFPASAQSRITVVPAYSPDALPELLADCSVGVFPSYMEGFPFGVLEMLAAAVPVIAYDCPGPSMMLSPEYLVARGDAPALCARVLDLLGDTARLAFARIRAQGDSQRFTWAQAAKETGSLYRERCEQLRTL